MLPRLIIFFFHQTRHALRNFISGEEPHILDIIIVSFIKNTGHKTYLLSNPLLKFCSQKPLNTKIFPMCKSSLFILFCKTNADFHQRAPLLFKLVGSLYVHILIFLAHNSFLDLASLIRTLCSMTPRIHFMLVMAQKYGYSIKNGSVDQGFYCLLMKIGHI